MTSNHTVAKDRCHAALVDRGTTDPLEVRDEVVK